MGNHHSRRNKYERRYMKMCLFIKMKPLYGYYHISTYMKFYYICRESQCNSFHAQTMIFSLFKSEPVKKVKYVHGVSSFRSCLSGV